MPDKITGRVYTFAGHELTILVDADTVCDAIAQGASVTIEVTPRKPVLYTYEVISTVPLKPTLEGELGLYATTEKPRLDHYVLAVRESGQSIRAELKNVREADR